jgi:hypothetical protein
MKEKNPLETAMTIALIIFFTSLSIILGFGTYWFICSINHWIAWAIVGLVYSGIFMGVMAPFVNKKGK